MIIKQIDNDCQTDRYDCQTENDCYIDTQIMVRNMLKVDQNRLYINLCYRYLARQINGIDKKDDT